MPGARRTPRRGAADDCGGKVGCWCLERLRTASATSYARPGSGLGLDQTKLAEITGLTADTINRFEAGLRTPTDAEAERLAARSA